MPNDDFCKKATGGNPLGAINLLNSNSNGDIIFKEAYTRKGLNSQSHKKRKAYQDEIQFGHCLPPQSNVSAQKPKCNIYNIGITPSGI